MAGHITRPYTPIYTISLSLHQIHMHSIPAEFCLALSYIESLVDLANSERIPTSILLYCSEALCKTLRRIDLVPQIKVPTFPQT